MSFNPEISEAWVNKGSKNIPVYTDYAKDTASGLYFPSGTQIGTIYPNEFYTSIAHTSNIHCENEIRFRNSSGAMKTGYILGWGGVSADPPDYYWDQQRYHTYNSNGTSLVSSSSVTINNISYRLFTVKKSTTMVNYLGQSSITLSANYQLATNTSEIGDSQRHRMLFRYYRSSSSGAWNTCYTGTNTYGYVDLAFAKGSMPSDRAIW